MGVFTVTLFKTNINTETTHYLKKNYEPFFSIANIWERSFNKNIQFSFYLLTQSTSGIHNKKNIRGHLFYEVFELVNICN